MSLTRVGRRFLRFPTDSDLPALDPSFRVQLLQRSYVQFAPLQRCDPFRRSARG